MKSLRCLMLAALAAAALPLPARAGDTAEMMRRLRDPKGGLIVVAHRGCHRAAPYSGLGLAPENSFAALDQCVALGVEVMETDVRRTRDGYLVMVHDETVDRTTDGHGKVSDLTLAQIKALHLRQDMGGAAQPFTGQTVPTLAEMLAHAKDRILLNLDVKDAIYGEVVAEVARAGLQDGVVVKTFAGAGSLPLASISPYDLVPFAVIPVSGDGSGVDVPAIVDAQMAGRRRPIAIELPYLAEARLAPIAARTRALGVRLWVNTLFDGFVLGGFSDLDALRDPEAVWGRLCGAGVSIVQTDEPAALIRYRGRAGNPCISSGKGK
ncbi:glycerophosphodiester phosphodiesterase family protein [Sphingomonas sp. TDK1]|uniref:glycerophosphodiester phosphodiesterase family protein n=1 Tax=Sphingomonas sp. TDK1 TaxID=453247 RepID=UPI0007D9C1F7|nr:glycerophosphodiester phosphodiesterase family protein [Sphingomonas sp. TDK1]OAN57560.1 glycerophosphodiester phosphodiesterase [Sphingomonas sp. TDK1]